jgi:probable rRNA maturation factor
MASVLPERDISVSEGGEPSLAEAEPPIGIVIDVVHDAGDWGSLDVASDAVMAAAGALAAELAIGGSEACVALSSDADVAQLNATYRGKTTATNVLSFPAAHAFAPVIGRPSLGDLVLAAETVEREAKELGLPRGHHLQHLVVHGLLHLLGYDHETDDEAEEMEALEVRILARLGIDNPFAAVGEPLTSRRQKPEPPKS